MIKHMAKASKIEEELPEKAFITFAFPTSLFLTQPQYYSIISHAEPLHNGRLEELSAGQMMTVWLEPIGG
jgi:hypothetical protein